MAGRRKTSKEPTAQLTMTVPVTCKAAIQNAAQARNMSMAAFMVFIAEHLKDDLVFFLDRGSFGMVLDELGARTIRAARRAARQETNLVLYEHGFIADFRE